MAVLEGQEIRTLNFLGRTALGLAAAVSVITWCGAAQAGTETVLHSFAGGSDGAYPVANLIADQSGNLYGTTEFGGDGCGKSCGCGTVFKLAPDCTETVLYAFHGGKDGRFPLAGLVLNSQGNLYGTTVEGGKPLCGTIFEVAQDGTETLLHTFQCHAGGEEPEAALVFDQAGDLYGTTTSGGTNNDGTVFELTATGVYTVLHSFKGGADGSIPTSQLIFDTAGNLYGTTGSGGGTGCDTIGCGTVFKFTPEGTETVLYPFQGGNDGSGPFGALIFDAAANLYGTTEVGGGSGCGGGGCGSVFELTPAGAETIVSKFNKAGGPEPPIGGVVTDASGVAAGRQGSPLRHHVLRRGIQTRYGFRDSKVRHRGARDWWAERRRGSVI